MNYLDIKKLDEKDRERVNLLRSHLVERAENVPDSGLSIDYLGKSFWVAKGVFWPFEDSKPLVENFLVNDGDEVLDVCTGSGVIAIESALRGAKRVVALDINPGAIRSTDFNSHKFRLEHIIEARVSDVLSALKEGERFDVVTCNPPFTNEDVSKANSITIKDKGFGVHKKFFETIKEYLKPNARIYFSQANFGDLENFFMLADNAGFDVKLIGEKEIPDDPRIFYAFELGLN